MFYIHYPKCYFDLYTVLCWHVFVPPNFEFHKVSYLKLYLLVALPIRITFEAQYYCKMLHGIHINTTLHSGCKLAY